MRDSMSVKSGRAAVDLQAQRMCEKVKVDRGGRGVGSLWEAASYVLAQSSHAVSAEHSPCDQ